MYPQPEVGESSSDWLGGISQAAQIGFDIYNTVKRLIPGGTVAGAGPVPGSGSAEFEELTELGSLIDGFEEVVGLGA